MEVNASVAQMYIRDGAQQVITKVHTGKIERIDTEIEQGSATEFWTDDALLMFDAIAESGSENTRLDLLVFSNGLRKSAFIGFDDTRNRVKLCLLSSIWSSSTFSP